ncbi:MAG TPA: XkdF-like putative serine protease domain-containing protein [Candidatus Thermoplasmatota archaeon]|nr:XkdF-like putative serine protease domain-containing protein [Candidatus Thermoplasmatota archaeon]
MTGKGRTLKLLDELVVKVVAFADVPADQDSRFLVIKTQKGEAVELEGFEVPVVKMVDGAPEERFVLGPVITPNKVDRQDEVIPPEVIRKAAHRFLAEYRMMDDLHNLAPLFGGANAGTPVESFVLDRDTEYDTPTGTKVTVPAGSWMLGTVVKDDRVWSEIKAGRRKGYSIWGTARKTRLPAGALPVSKNKEDPNMEPEQLKEEMAKVADEAVSKALSPIKKTLDALATQLNAVEIVAKKLDGVDLVSVQKTLGDVQTLVNAHAEILKEPVVKVLKQQANPPQPHRASFWDHVPEKKNA